MPRLFVRQTYLRTAGRRAGREPAAPPVLGTHTGVGGAFPADLTAWQQEKPATYGGARAWLRLQLQLHQPFGATTPGREVLGQRDYHFRLAAEPPRRAYRLYGYVPFSTREEAAYRRAPSAALGQQMLGQALQYDLGRIAPHLGQNPQCALAIRELRLRRPKQGRYRGRCCLTFDLSFTVPMLLPEYLGLGWGVGEGLGMVRVGK